MKKQKKRPSATILAVKVFRLSICREVGFYRTDNGYNKNIVLLVGLHSFVIKNYKADRSHAVSQRLFILCVTVQMLDP